MASRALESCGEAAVDPLILALWSTDVDTRHYVIRSLSHIGSPRAVQALLHILSLEAEEAYYDLVRLEKIQQLPQTSGVRLLTTTLTERVAQAKRNALQVLHAAYSDRRGMRLILSNLNHPEPYVRSSAIEALEVRSDSALVGGILPLFEHASPKVTAEHGGSLFQLPSKKPLEVLFELSGDRSRWLRACALYALGQVGDERAIRVLERKVSSDPYELAKLNAIEALGELSGSAGLPILERAGKEYGGRVRQYANAASAKIRSRIAKATE
jgi:HEAT repeat protein